MIPYCSASSLTLFRRHVCHLCCSLLHLLANICEVLERKDTSVAFSILPHRQLFVGGTNCLFRSHLDDSRDFCYITYNVYQNITGGDKNADSMSRTVFNVMRGAR